MDDVDIDDDAGAQRLWVPCIGVTLFALAPTPRGFRQETAHGQLALRRAGWADTSVQLWCTARSRARYKVYNCTNALEGRQIKVRYQPPD